MSPDLERLIGRAVIDQKFRDELLKDPDAAIANSGLKLSDDEIKKVKAAAEARRVDSAGTNRNLDAAKGTQWG
ncbi:Franean1_4349 family RiPP [Chloroflexales bacterium ZM16-3]|nr:Franean1_4349 family RiPP [Chloroflexales bacterium ZM16-3]